MRRLLLIATLICIVSLSNGCSSLAFWQKEDKPPTQVNLLLHTDSGVNPDQQGHAAPVAIKLFQLQAPDAFLQADFFKLYQDPKVALGADLIKQQQWVLGPNAQQAILLPLDKQTEYIGVFAAYQNYPQVVWRVSIPIRQIRKSNLAIELNAKGIYLQGEKNDK